MVISDSKSAHLTILESYRKYLDFKLHTLKTLSKSDLNVNFHKRVLEKGQLSHFNKNFNDFLPPWINKTKDIFQVFVFRAKYSKYMFETRYLMNISETKIVAQYDGNKIWSFNPHDLTPSTLEKEHTSNT